MLTALIALCGGFIYAKTSVRRELKSNELAREEQQPCRRCRRAAAASIVFRASPVPRHACQEVRLASMRNIIKAYHNFP